MTDQIVRGSNPHATHKRLKDMGDGTFAEVVAIAGNFDSTGQPFDPAACSHAYANTVDLVTTDGTAFGAYTSGGTLTRAKFYALKPSVDIATVTSGATLATDHWGTAGVAALFDELPMAFATTYPNNGFGQRYGNGASAVFGLATANDRTRAMAGMPAAGGVSAAGSNAMGADWFYQYLLNQLCVISRGYWGHGSNAGGRFRVLDNARSAASYVVGFAASVYL